MTISAPVDDSQGQTMEALLPSFRLHLRAKNLATRTAASYSEAVEQFSLFLRERGLPLGPTAITRGHIEEWEVYLLDHRRPATAANRHKSLAQFFKWLAAEGEIAASPMVRMAVPAVPDEPVPVLSADEIARLLRSCSGSDFVDRRDAALFRTFLDTGARLSEVANLRFSSEPRSSDIDLEQGAIYVVGKGSRPRVVPIGTRTMTAIDRYVRARAKRPRASEPWLWVGPRGRLNSDGVQHVAKKRAAQAGLAHLHVHQFRHTFASEWLMNGGNEGDLMALGLAKLGDASSLRRCHRQ